MKELNVSYHNYAVLVQDLAKGFDVPVTNNQVPIPRNMGEGFVRGVSLDSGLSVLVADMLLNQDFVVERPVTEKEFYVLHFHEKNKVQQHTAGDQPAMKGNTVYAGVHVEDSSQPSSFTLSAQARFKTVNIIMHKSWLEGIMNAEQARALMQTLEDRLKESFKVDMIDVEYRMLLNELLSEEITHPMPELFIKNRVLLLIEKFFNRLYHRSNNPLGRRPVSEAELQRLVQVEKKLTANVQETPPTIEQLAKMAAMSSTKLKGLFKDVFGMPIYEYYQHNRMNIAKEILLTRRFTVKETGQQVGYQNISHFAAAFKKVHGILPSEILGSNR